MLCRHCGNLHIHVSDDDFYQESGVRKVAHDTLLSIYSGLHDFNRILGAVDLRLDERCQISLLSIIPSRIRLSFSHFEAQQCSFSQLYPSPSSQTFSYSRYATKEIELMIAYHPGRSICNRRTCRCFGRQCTVGNFNHVGNICRRPSCRKSLYRVDRRYFHLFFQLVVDRISTHRSTLLAGTVALLGGTLLFCFGHSLAVYIFARFLQGISSAVVWIVGFILLKQYSQ